MKADYLFGLLISIRQSATVNNVILIVLDQQGRQSFQYPKLIVVMFLPALC